MVRIAEPLGGQTRLLRDLPWPRRGDREPGREQPDGPSVPTTVSSTLRAEPSGTTRSTSRWPSWWPRSGPRCSAGYTGGSADTLIPNRFARPSSTAADSMRLLTAGRNPHYGSRPAHSSPQATPCWSIAGRLVEHARGTPEGRSSSSRMVSLSSSATHQGRRLDEHIPETLQDLLSHDPTGLGSVIEAFEQELPGSSGDSPGRERADSMRAPFLAGPVFDVPLLRQRVA